MKTQTRPDINAGPGTAAAWWLALRYHFAPCSFLPAFLGGVLAWALTGLLNPWYFFLTVLGITANAVALHLTDDYYDYLAAVDSEDSSGNNPYAGGSGVLTGGLIRPRAMRAVFIAGYLLTLGIGLYLAAVATWWVLAFTFFGVGCAFFYTAPPVRYGYHGLGEVSQMVNFSFTIGMGAYVVQTVRFSGEALLVLLPLGFMMFAMIIINEIPDAAGDAAAGKNTLVVRGGVQRAVLLYGLAMALAYAVIILAPLYGLASPWIYLALLGLPWTVRACRILAAHRDQPARLAPANLLTIRIHNLTGILLTAAYLIQGMLNKRELAPAGVALLLLAVFYLPAAVPVFFRPPVAVPAAKPQA